MGGNVDQFATLCCMDGGMVRDNFTENMPFR